MTSSRIDVIPDSHRALLDGPIVVSPATQMKSGPIQVQVTVLAVDPANVYHGIESACCSGSRPGEC